MENKGLSFGFSKKIENKTLQKSSLNEAQEERETADFITSIEDKRVKGSKPETKAKEYVIPLIKQNRWRQGESADGVEGQAVQELLEDVAKQNEEWQERGKVTSDLAIPLLMQNRVPDGFETDDKLDVSLRPDEPEEADFEAVPIDQFGMAMLKGMGWKEGDGIGRNNKAAAPVVATLRPKGMGLGADRSQIKQLNYSTGSKKDDEKEELVLKKGSYCVIVKGSNKDLYGQIEGLDEDNCRVMVKLTLSGKNISQSQYGIKLVTEKEHKKYSKYLNKGKADEYKEKDEKRSRHKESPHHKHSKRHRDSSKDRERSHSRERDEKRKEKRSRAEDYEREERVRERLGGDRREDESRSDGSRRHEREGTSDRKRKYDERDNKSSNGASCHTTPWVRPQIRVRLIDKNYKKGRYYKEKITVLDLAGPENCICQTDDGKVLDDISTSSLETVIPKSDDGYVVIVNGKSKGQVAQIMKKDKKTCQAAVQLLSDRDCVIKVSYDDICEFTGDINDLFDY